MLRALSPKEELKHRWESFAKLKEGILFDLAQERFFIAVRKTDEETWEVIELTQDNKKQIILGRQAARALETAVRKCFDFVVRLIFLWVALNQLAQAQT
jgi:protease II